MVSIAFISFNEQIRKWFKQVNKLISKPVVMILVGLLMGLAGWWQPGVLGVGYESMNQILHGAFSEQTVLILLVLKFVLVALILGVGGFGGVFAPLIFLGGAFGFLFAQTVSAIFGRVALIQRMKPCGTWF